MANWCYHEVTFSGTEEALQMASSLFLEIRQRQEETNELILPNFVSSDNGHMADITVNDHHIFYATRWVPNLEVLVAFGEHFGLGFTCQYEELGNGIFGEAVYQDGILENIRLDSHDLMAYHYDDTDDRYVYGDLRYEDEWSVLTQLLEIKKAERKQFQTVSDTSRAELESLYGRLSAGDLIFRLAEHKNFKQAALYFDALERKDILEIAGFLSGLERDNDQLPLSSEQQTACKYLKHLVGTWEDEQANLQKHHRFDR